MIKRKITEIEFIYHMDPQNITIKVTKQKRHYVNIVQQGYYIIEIEFKNDESQEKQYAPLTTKKTMNDFWSFYLPLEHYNKNIKFPEFPNQHFVVSSTQAEQRIETFQKIFDMILVNA